MDFGQQFVLVSRPTARLKQAMYHPMFTAGKSDYSFGHALQAVAGKDCILACQAVREIKRECNSGMLRKPSLPKSLFDCRHSIWVSQSGSAPVSLASLVYKLYEDGKVTADEVESVWDRAVCQILLKYLAHWVAEDRDGYLMYFSSNYTAPRRPYLLPSSG